VTVTGLFAISVSGYAPRFFFCPLDDEVIFAAVRFTFTVSSPGTTDTITTSTSTPDMPIRASSPGTGVALHNRTCRIFGIFS